MFMNRLPKPFLFALFAALGSLAAALLGEVFLNLVHPPPPPLHDVVLLIDTSGSMHGSKLEEVKQAATHFIERRQRSKLSHDRLAIIQFGGEVLVKNELTNDSATLLEAVNSLQAHGNTPMGEGIEKALEQFSSYTHQRDILLFTDGAPTEGTPNPVRAVFNAGEVAKQQGIRVIAVATSDANKSLLTQLTGHANLLFPTDVGAFEQAFQAAEKVIYGMNPLETQITPGLSLGYSLLQVLGWTGLLALGMSLFLIIGQNFYLHRPLITRQEFFIGMIGSLMVGMLAGLAGELLFYALLGTKVSSLEEDSMPFFWGYLATTVLAWTVLGLLLGRGMAWFIPNLDKIRASLGGSLGGFLGALCFLGLAHLLSDTQARWVGATTVGFFIGLMVALVELYKEAWLVIHWGPKDTSLLTLGEEPILVGSSKNAHIYVSEQEGFPSEMGTLTFHQGIIEFHNHMTGQRQILKNGSHWKIGHLNIEVKTR